MKQGNYAARRDFTAHHSMLLSRIPRNVSLQLMDGAILGGDDPVDQVANRNDAYDLTAVEDWQVPDTMARHQAHAFFHRVSRSDLDDLARKDFLHGGFL